MRPTCASVRPAELDGRRKQAQADGRPPGYDGRCRALDPAESATRRDNGEAAVLRLAVPRPGETVFDDIVGAKSVSATITSRTSCCCGQTVRRPITSPAPSTTSTSRSPTSCAAKTSCRRPPSTFSSRVRWAPTPPVYAHLSLLMGPDGKKLSKRHGDTALHAYRARRLPPRGLRQLRGPARLELRR